MESNTQDANEAGESQVSGNTPGDSTNVDLARLSQLEQEVDALKQKASEYLDGWQRARAEFANYKKRQESDYANLRVLSTSVLVGKLLPVMDDFERANKTLPPALRDMTWIEGVMLILRKMQLILDSEGVKAIEVKPNDVFDPSVHEAVSHDVAEGITSGSIIEELQKGYRLGDRVIRPTLVRVAQ
jgi:molecular chaperone GrpE